MLAIIAGTRPELLKLASLFEILEEKGEEYLFIWTGQHYDYEMSRVFIEELSLPEPDITLDIPRNGEEVQRTTTMIIRLHNVLKNNRIEMTASLGDTDSVLASALASIKTRIPFVHIESGYRSWDLAMPEEINRIIADHIAAFLFAPTKLSFLNLVHEGISRNYISIVGSPLIDIVYKHDKIISNTGDRVLNDLGLERENYLLVTIHRQENVDDPTNLKMILKALLELSNQIKIIIPIHPRTKKRLHEARLYGLLVENKNIIVTKPLDYFRFIGLLRNSYATITDSGGVLEEATVYKVPVIIPRKTIEKPEILALGLGILTGPYTSNIIRAFDALTKVRSKVIENIMGKENPFGDGTSGYKIYNKILEIRDKQEYRTIQPDYRETPLVVYTLLKKTQYSTYNDCLREDLYYYNDKGVASTEIEEAETIVSRLRCRVDTIWLREYLS